MHKFIEKKFLASDSFPEVLEIGSDQGQHRNYVKHQYVRYLQCDLHLPKKPSKDFRVQSIIGDIRRLPFKNSEFDRVIVTCVLHHLPNLELPLCEIARVTKPGGVITILFPKEPSLTYSYVRNFLMLVKHRNLRKVEQYRELHKQQHIGDYKIIIQAVKANKLFAIKELRRFPFPPFTLLYCFSLIRI
jgi:SAM-dependent methyltransferase